MAVVSASPQVALRNILVATDFSACSQVALHCAAALARQANSTIFLAHVVAYAPMSPIPMDASPVFFPPIADDPSFRMRQLLSTPEFAGIPHEALLGQGDLGGVLQEMIQNHHVDVVVMGTHGRDGLGKLALGSVAEHLFRHARCPVITVGPHVVADVFEQGRLTRVVFASDLLPSSLHALEYAIGLAESRQASLTLVHALACAIPYEDERPRFGAEEEMGKVRSQLKYMLPDGVQADVVVEIGLPDQVIVEVARRQRASMIVLGLHAQSSEFLAEHLPWTTAHRVVCDAHCPVMTVR